MKSHPRRTGPNRDHRLQLQSLRLIATMTCDDEAEELLAFYGPVKVPTRGPQKNHGPGEAENTTGQMPASETEVPFGHAILALDTREEKAGDDK